jgi:hypothetical protein
MHASFALLRLKWDDLMLYSVKQAASAARLPTAFVSVTRHPRVSNGIPSKLRAVGTMCKYEVPALWVSKCDPWFPEI